MLNCKAVTGTDTIFARSYMETVIGKDITTAAAFLMKGEVVAVPTETVYGLAGNALDENAVLKIYAAKNRPSFNPLIIHVAAWEQVKDYVLEIPPMADLLAQYFCPGPLTFLLPKKNIVPDIVTAGSDLVAVRIPNHPMTLSLLQQLPFPLAAPSANPFGYISPTTATHVLQGLSGKIPYILDGGATTVGVESTIIGFDEKGNVLLHRTGGISKEQVEAVTGAAVKQVIPVKEDQPATSGQLKSHYAPHTPLYVGNVDALIQQFAGKQIAVISFTKKYAAVRHCYVLSENGDLSEAARHLFAVLRESDAAGYDVILAEKFPEEGLGLAINDRLSRAQAIFKS